MNALHYAAYFDVPELIRVILKNAKPKGRHCSFFFRVVVCILLLC